MKETHNPPQNTNNAIFLNSDLTCDRTWLLSKKTPGSCSVDFKAYKTTFYIPHFHES
jgi:hypothetical protein